MQVKCKFSGIEHVLYSFFFFLFLVFEQHLVGFFILFCFALFCDPLPVSLSCQEKNANSVSKVRQKS